MFSIAEITTRPDWDGALLELPSPHILQSWAWGETKAQTGWRARRLAWRQGERPVAAAALLIRRLAARLPIAVAYAPKGPLLDWADAPLAEAVLERIETEARRAGAIFVKIDPDVRADSPAGEAVVAALTRRGWRFSGEQIQYRNTVISDLAPAEDDLLAAMKPKWRYNIRLAERKGVTVRAGTLEDFPAFYALMQETGARDRFGVHSEAYYRRALELFLPAGAASLWLAEVAGEPVAALVAFALGTKAWYFYGASSGRHREKMPAYALQWAAIRWARARGCMTYDLWGIPDADEATLEAEFEQRHDGLWGVYRFKRGFGGQVTRFVGLWEQPLHPLYPLAARLWARRKTEL